MVTMVFQILMSPLGIRRSPSTQWAVAGGGNDTTALGGKINTLNEKNVNLLLKNFKLLG